MPYIRILKTFALAACIAVLAAGVSIGCCTSGGAGKVDWSRVDVTQCQAVFEDAPPIAGEIATCFAGSNYESCVEAIVLAGKATPEIVACVASLVAALGADHAPGTVTPDAAPVHNAKQFLDAHVPDAGAVQTRARPQPLLKLNQARAAGVSLSTPGTRARAWLAARGQR